MSESYTNKYISLYEKIELVTYQKKNTYHEGELKNYGIEKY